MLPDDIVLLKQLQQGNHLAFRTLYEKYWEHLYAVAYHWLGSQEEAQEIVQEVFVELWEKRSCLVIRKSWAAYLFAVAKFKVFDCLDARAVRRRYVIGQQQAPASLHEEGHQRLVAQETQQSIREALAQLPAKTQQIFSLSRERELSYAEIAQLMNISVKSVEYHITKTLKHLRLIVRSVVILLLLLG